MLSNIIPKSQLQLTLFSNNTDILKRENLMIAVDKLNKKIGGNKIKFAINGFEKKWGMRQKNLSPCYTTCINDLIKIKY